MPLTAHSSTQKGPGSEQELDKVTNKTKQDLSKNLSKDPRLHPNNIKAKVKYHLLGPNLGCYSKLTLSSSSLTTLSQMEKNAPQKHDCRRAPKPRGNKNTPGIRDLGEARGSDILARPS